MFHSSIYWAFPSLAYSHVSQGMHFGCFSSTRLLTLHSHLVVFSSSGMLEMWHFSNTRTIVIPGQHDSLREVTMEKFLVLLVSLSTRFLSSSQWENQPVGCHSAVCMSLCTKPAAAAEDDDHSSIHVPHGAPHSVSFGHRSLSGSFSVLHPHITFSQPCIKSS